MMYGEPDAAAAMGVPTRRLAGAGADLRVQGLERRRRRRLDAPSRSSAARWARAGSRRSIPRSSTTSRPRVRGSSWSRARPAQIVWPAVELYEARVPRAPRDLVLLSRHRAVVALADVQPARSSSWPRRSAPSSWSRSARCSPTCRTRARCRSPAWPPTPALVARLGLTPSSYEGPTGIVGDPARRLPGGRPAVGEPVGGRPALHRRRAEPEGRARAGAQARGPRRRGRRRAPSSRPPPPTTSARSTWRSRATPTSRRSSSASSRPPSDEERAIDPARCPRARRSPATSSASCASAATTTPPLPSVRPPRRGARRSALGRRAHQPVVAHRARRERRRRLEPLRQDALGDLDRDLADPLRAVAVRRSAPRPSRRRARSSRPAGRPRGSRPRARPPRTATAARRRRAARRSSGRPVL